MRNSDRIEFCTLNGDTIGASREFTLHLYWYSGEKIYGCIVSNLSINEDAVFGPFAILHNIL